MLIALVIGVAALILSIVGAVMLIFSRNYIETQYKQSHDSYMALFSDFLGNEFDNIVDDARELLENEDYVAVMEANQETIAGSLYFSAAEQAKIDTLLSDIEDDNEFIRGILAVSNSGKFRYVAKKGNNTPMYDYYRGNNLMEASWLTTAREALGKEVILSWNVLDINDQDNLSIVKETINPTTRKGMGFIVITVSKKIIQQAFSGHGNILENNRYFIVNPKLESDQEQYLIYSKNLEDEDIEEILNDYVSGDDSNYVYGSHYEDRTGWDIISVIPKDDLDAATYPISLYIVVCMFLVLAISIPLSGFLVSRIDRPLNQLEKAISALADGDYRPDINFDDSEIGQVGKYLLDISRNNLELREKLLSSELNEKEAELLLLQERINPHFLYNTLDALYFMAVIDGADDVAEMVKNLSEVFKLSLNKGDKLITIRDELEKVRAYMKIQNMRYQDKFMLEIDVDEDIKDYRILTFLLQPVVENAVIHGLEGKVGSGTVSIIGYQEDDEIRITIHDNGVGIEDLSRLESGYGVRNVKERIRLYYGESYQVSIESALGQGTTVFFRFPIEGKDV